MNLFFVHARRHHRDPRADRHDPRGRDPRSSILELAQDLGLKVDERRVSIDEWRDGAASGEITEVFACGTAAVITPVGKLVWDGGSVGDMATGRAADDAGSGRRWSTSSTAGPDTHGWMRRPAAPLGNQSKRRRPGRA